MLIQIKIYLFTIFGFLSSLVAPDPCCSLQADFDKLSILVVFNPLDCRIYNAGGKHIVKKFGSK